MLMNETMARLSELRLFGMITGGAASHDRILGPELTNAWAWWWIGR